MKTPTDSEIQAYREALRAYLRRQLVEAVAARDALDERKEATDRAYWHARCALYERARAAVKRIGAVATIEALQKVLHAPHAGGVDVVECIAVVKGIAYGMRLTEYLESESGFSWIKQRQDAAGKARE